MSVEEWKQAKKYLIFYAKNDSIIKRRDIRNQLKDAVAVGDNMAHAIATGYCGECECYKQIISELQEEKAIIFSHLRACKISLDMANEAVHQARQENKQLRQFLAIKPENKEYEYLKKLVALRELIESYKGRKSFYLAVKEAFGDE